MKKNIGIMKRLPKNPTFFIDYHIRSAIWFKIISYFRKLIKRQMSEELYFGLNRNKRTILSENESINYKTISNHLFGIPT